MHTLALILAAEKSKVPFYIAGGLLVAWALIVSLGLGMRIKGFPGNAQGQRTIMAISAVLVVGAVSTAVITSGGHVEKSEAAQSGSEQGASTSEEAPAQTSTAETSPPASSVQTGSATTPAPPKRPPAATATTALKLAADPGGQLSYDAKQLTAKAGTVTIAFTNAAPEEHNVAVSLGGKVEGSLPPFTGGTKTLRLKLKPGKYTFYCTVPGHRQAGMEGTLTVS